MASTDREVKNHNEGDSQTPKPLYNNTTNPQHSEIWEFNDLKRKYKENSVPEFTIYTDKISTENLPLLKKITQVTINSAIEDNNNIAFMYDTFGTPMECDLKEIAKLLRILLLSRKNSLILDLQKQHIPLLSPRQVGHRLKINPMVPPVKNHPIKNKTP